jgi:hypothetical protein
MRGTDEKTCAQSREELGKSPLSAWPETPYLGFVRVTPGTMLARVLSDALFVASC